MATKFPAVAELYGSNTHQVHLGLADHTIALIHNHAALTAPAQVAASAGPTGPATTKRVSVSNLGVLFTLSMKFTSCTNLHCEYRIHNSIIIARQYNDGNRRI
jgi:hypothetical protein